jgi:hypothetical protein
MAATSYEKFFDGQFKNFGFAPKIRRFGKNYWQTRPLPKSPSPADSKNPWLTFSTAVPRTTHFPLKFYEKIKWQWGSFIALRIFEQN